MSHGTETSIQQTRTLTSTLSHTHSASMTVPYHSFVNCSYTSCSVGIVLCQCSAEANAAVNVSRLRGPSDSWQLETKKSSAICQKWFSLKILRLTWNLMVDQMIMCFSRERLRRVLRKKAAVILDLHTCAPSDLDLHTFTPADLDFTPSHLQI